MLVKKFAFDKRTERCIAELLPWVRVLARRHIVACMVVGIDARIISGYRTYEEQTELYAKGRTSPGARVTMAKAGYSSHNFRTAYDVGIFDAGDYLEESPLYDAVGKIGKTKSLFWGGDWRKFVDKPHFDGSNMAMEIRRKCHRLGLTIPAPKP